MNKIAPLRIGMDCLLISILWLLSDSVGLLQRFPSTVIDFNYVVSQLGFAELLPLLKTLFLELVLLLLVNLPIVWLIHRFAKPIPKIRFLLIVLSQLAAITLVSLLNVESTYSLFKSFTLNLGSLICCLALFFYFLNQGLQLATFVLLSSSLAAGFLVYGSLLTDAEPQVTEQPNIFLIGVDSLRLDTFDLASGGVFEQLRESGVFYTNIYTPMARTHVALTSLLTGLQPIEHGARFNLMAPKNCALDRSLPAKLKAIGYKTFFAMDERRFSNISESYGFDVTVGPQPGSSEMILSSFVKHPWAVLLNQFRWVSDFYSYRVINRARPDMYEANIFTTQILDQLVGEEKSIFAHTHFTLAHWPYVNDPEPHGEYSIDDNYLLSIQEVETQIGDYIDTLTVMGLLDNALVYFYSDHGESIKMTDQPIGYFKEHSVAGTGHGTSVLSEAQYRVPVVFLQYRNGKVVSRSGRSDELGSLVEIYESLLAQVESSVAGLIHGAPNLSSEAVYLETGRVSPSLFLDSLNESRIIEENLTQFVLEGPAVVFDQSQVVSELGKKQVARVTPSAVLSYSGRQNCFKFSSEGYGGFGECISKEDLDVEWTRTAMQLEELVRIPYYEGCSSVL